jgi:hypothetical protein
MTAFHRRLLFALWVSSAVFLGCQSGGSGDRSGFIAYYADPTAYCDRTAECEVQDEADCVSSWPSESQTTRALDLAQLSSDQLADCESAARAYDTCYLALSCEELQTAESPCVPEGQRFELDCAELLTAFEMTPIEDPDGDEPDDDDRDVVVGVANAAAAEALCQLSQDCSGSPAPGSPFQQCVDTASRSFSLLPDPDRVVECLEETGCDEIEAGGEDAALGCIAIDASTTECRDDDTLHICDTFGACSTIECPSFCAQQGFGVVGCAFDEPSGYDKCECSL